MFCHILRHGCISSRFIMVLLRYKVASFKVNTVLKVLAHDKVKVEKNPGCQQSVSKSSRSFL